MFKRVRTAVSLVPAFVRLIRSEYVDLEDFLSAADRMEHVLQDKIRAEPALGALAARPPMEPLPPTAELLELPENTVGHALGQMLASQGFDHITADYPDTEVGRVRRWLELTHDLWHVTTGFGTDIPGELGVQAVYLAQLDERISMFAMGVFMLKSVQEDRERVHLCFDAISLGWAMGRDMEQLASVDWIAELETPLDELRARLGVTPATGLLSQGRYAEDRAAMAA